VRREAALRPKTVHVDEPPEIECGSSPCTVYGRLWACYAGPTSNRWSSLRVLAAIPLLGVSVSLW